MSKASRSSNYDSSLETGKGASPSVAPGKRSLVDRNMVSRKATGPDKQSGQADPAAAVDKASASSGAALDPASRQRGESFLGVDLDGVRVHTGGDSAAAAEGISARAYTQGSDIHFGSGAYQPGTPQGDHLIAHELVHVAQQQSGPSGAPQRSALQVSQTHDPAEVEAERGADAIMSGRSFQASASASASPAAVSREALGGNPAERKDSAGNPTTTHKAPGIDDSINHAKPTAAGNEAKLSTVRVVAGEGSKLHLEPPGSPVPDLVYQEGAAVSPPPAGFTEVNQFRGTMSQPTVEEEADSSLFINGEPGAGDVQQMSIGDCYFESTAMSIASRDPGKIKSMMAPDGRGGATVTLWRRQAHTKSWLESMAGGPDYDYIPVQVSVSNDLAFNIGGGIHGSQLRSSPTPKSSDWWAKVNGGALEVHRKDVFQCARWAPLLEKAFARFAQQHGQYGGARPGKAAGGSGYDDIDGGVPMYALSVIYGSQADSKAANVKRENTAWTPGGNVLTANPRVVDQLLLLAGRGEDSKAGEKDAPILTAQTFEIDMVNKLGLALPVAIADPDFAKLDAERQAKVQAVQASWTTWNALPPDVAPVVAKAAAYTGIGTACGAAVAPGPVDVTKLNAVKKANPGVIKFENESDQVPAASAPALAAFGAQLAANPSPVTNVGVAGHSSSKGAEKYNQELSQRRADNVATSLRGAGAVEPPHRLQVTALGEEGADASPDWRRVDISVDAVEGENHLHDVSRAPAIRAAMDLMLDLRNMGTDKSPGQRNVYGGHSYSVVGVSFVNTGGAPVALQGVPAAARPAMYPMVDTNVSTVRLRNPHHNNEPDRKGDNKATRPEDGTPTGGSTDGIFTMSLEEFFRNFSAVDSGVFPRS
ncbi:MAG TPA: DUF4157 domain-containing protein [Kofleriaceae bacterium]|nr:DUF4157 domain-containing protein [Kofleriaceae bacterium]